MVGTPNFSCPHAEINLREGGNYLICMRSSVGKDYWSTGIYKNINAPKKLIFSDSFSDPEGSVVPASYYDFVAEFPPVMEIELILDEIPKPE